jgi:ribosome-associated protein
MTIAELAAEAASAVKPTYLAILDLRGLSGFTDYFVIASADSSRQVRALAERVEERLALARVRMLHREGAREAHWILLDYHDVVVHIFDEQTRQFYDLERLWGDAPKRMLVGGSSAQIG